MPADKTSPQMTTNQITSGIGADLIMRSVNERQSTAHEINFLARFRKTRQRRAFVEAAQTLIHITDELKRHGFLQKVAGLSPTQMDFLEHSREHLFLLFSDLDERDDPQLDVMLSGLCRFVDACAPAITRVAMPAPPPPPPVAPLPVQIVGMPATTAVQVVERDDDDEITRTVTVTQPHTSHAKALQT